MKKRNAFMFNPDELYGEKADIFEQIAKQKDPDQKLKTFLPLVF